MSKSAKQYLTVDVTQPGTPKPYVRIEGSEFSSDRRRDDGNQCYMWLSESETRWLIGELQRALVEIAEVSGPK